MVYLDATAAAESPMNCGIPRTIRRLYAALRECVKVTPVIWSKHHQAYCLLSALERGFLERPFDRYDGPQAAPYAQQHRWRNVVDRQLGRWRRVLSFDRLCQEGNKFLLPNMEDDGRSVWMERAAADGRLQLAVVFHDAIAYVRPELAPGVPRQELKALLRSMSLCRFAVACSAESRETLLRAWREMGCRAAPVMVEAWPTEFGVRGDADPAGFDRRRVLCVSSLAPRKNHLTLLAACEKLWSEGLHFELVLIGRQFREVEGGLPVVEAVLRMEKAGRPVRWLKHVSDVELEAAYRGCSFTVFPSLCEGFGLPIHESLWFGRPCVCGTNGALGEVSAGGGCLLCDQTSRDSLASAMARLLTDRALYVKLSQEAAERRFRTWADYAKSLLSYLEGPLPAQACAALDR